MGKWYVMRTIPGKEQQAAELMERTAERSLWTQWRILKKQKLFRVKGRLFLNVDDMFPGYIFVETDHPEELQEQLEKSREYPTLTGNLSGNMRGNPAAGKREVEIIAVEEKDLEFLKNVCGSELDKAMALSMVEADKEGNLVRIDGILEKYENRITRKRLRKRYVLAQVDLFCRKEDILFGICLPGDEIYQTVKTSR